MIEKLLIGIAGLIILLVAVVTILAFVLPTELRAERAVTINKPKADVFAYVKMLKNQNDWGRGSKRTRR